MKGQKPIDMNEHLEPGDRSIQTSHQITNFRS